MTPLLMLGPWLTKYIVAGGLGLQQHAAGTSIAGVVFTGISGAIAYCRKHVVDYRTGLLFMPTALMGTFIGNYIVRSVSSSVLSIAFGIFLLYPAIMMLAGKTPKDAKARLKGWSSGWRYYSLVGLIGLVAGIATRLFGIGGGTVFVPSLVMLLGMDIHTAVATSLFVMVPTAISSATTSYINGTLHFELAIPLILGIIIGAQLGPQIGHRVPQKRLRQLFGLVLIFIAIRMVVREIIGML